MRLLRHTMRSPPPALARAPHRQYMDIDFTDAPVDLHWLTFENYYTATVTVLSAEVHPTTSRVRFIGKWTVVNVRFHTCVATQSW